MLYNGIYKAHSHREKKHLRAGGTYALGGGMYEVTGGTYVFPGAGA